MRTTAESARGSIEPAAEGGSSPGRMAAPAGHWVRRLWLPIALHLALCLGLYQVGLTKREMQKLQIEGPSHMIDAYVRALHVFGPFGVVRAYFRGESDERLYLEYSRLLLTGRIDMDYVAERQNDPRLLATRLPTRAFPYRDVRVEYPPLAFAAMLPPALVANTYSGYRRAFIAFMLALHALNLLLAFRLLRPFIPSDPEQGVRVASRAAYASLVLCAALGSVFVTRLDHIVVTPMLLCLLAFARAQQTMGAARVRWSAACGAFAAIGVMVKIAPGLAGLAAVALLWQSGARDRLKCVAAATLAGLLVLVSVNLAMYALAGPAYLETYRYHTARGVQLESLYAGVLLLLRPFGLRMHIEESFGSTNLASAATELIKRLSPLLFFATAGYVLLRRRFAPDGRGALALTCVLLAIFMLTNRVFSPQYLIWIAAPVSLLAALSPERRGTWLLLACAVLLSQLIFPRGYPILKAFHPLGVAVLNLRNLLLAGFTWQLVRVYSSAWRDAPPSPARAPSN